MKKTLVAAGVFIMFFTLFGGVERSISFIPFGNGTGIGIYDIKRDAKLMSFYEHIYKNYDEQTATENVLKEGIVWGLNDKWLSKAKLISAEYIEGTGIVKVVKELENFEVTEYYFMPFSTDKRILISEIDVKNRGEEQLVTPYLYIDGFAGGYSSSGQEKINVENGVITEESIRRSGNNTLIYAMSDMNGYTFKQKSAFPATIKTNTVTTDNTISDAKMVTAVLSGKKKTIKNGETIRFRMVFTSSKPENVKEYIDDVIKYRDAKSLLTETEAAGWEQWHKTENYPVGIKEDEKRLFKQSTAVIRMGQSRENNESKGQILASLPPGEWSISWPRDASYSIVALARTGHFNEAREGLRFMFDAPGGKFTGDEFIGRKYKISVCRYYGNGTEESDYNSQGPNIEFDDFGLVLWAFSEYIENSKDIEFLEKYRKVIDEEIADVLVSLMEKEGYLKPDSSIWERHWEPDSHPDGKKRFAYSTICAANGLMRYGKAAGGNKGEEYIKQGKIIRDALNNYFIENGIIVQALELKNKGITEYMDAANVEAVNFGLVNDDIALRNLEAYEKYLKIKNGIGFKRNDDGTWYDDQEWTIIDMRIASAYLKFNKQRSYELIRWVTDNSTANFNLVAELYESITHKYEGAIPMCGFGAGTYIMALQDYYRQ